MDSQGDSSDAWRRFDARYRPLLLRFIRSLGLSEDAAADAAQETLLQFLREFRQGRFDRERGGLTGWLIAMARSRVAQSRRRSARRQESPTDPEAVNIDLDDEHALTRLWTQQRRALVLEQAMDELWTRSRLDPRTIRIFELLVLRQVPALAVAREMQLTRADVYVARSRVARRLRDIIARIESEFDSV
jgi:RNA polymerase sigma factor (sigma-70 family)